MTTVFITGAGGFVGHNLLQYLATTPDSPTIIAHARQWSKHPWVHDIVQTMNNRLQLVEGDLTRAETYQTALTHDVDIIIHNAAKVGFALETDFSADNITATQCLLHAIQQHCPQLKRLVFISTIAAVDRPSGSKQPYKPLTETDPCYPQSAYGQSKLEGEILVKESGLPFTILRPPLILGAHLRDTSPIRTMMSQALSGHPLTWIPFPGEFSEIFVGDFCEAIWTSARHERCINETYFVANPTPTKVTDFIYSICHLSEKAYQKLTLPMPVMWLIRCFTQWVVSDYLTSFVFEPRMVCSSEKLKQHTGFTPYYGFMVGLKETLASYQQRQLL